MEKRAINTVYTIGYAGFPLGSFISVLKSNNILLLVDVRSLPFSNRYPEYNKDTLEKHLKENGIHYRNYANEFGARQNDRMYYCKEGYLDFETFSQSDAFLGGIKKLCKSMQENYTFALMCAEKDPIDCHRAILVSRSFSELGYRVIHLLPNGHSMTQEDINTLLMDKYYPNRNQLSFLDGVQDESALLKDAYRHRNAEIGYRMEDI